MKQRIGRGDRTRDRADRRGSARSGRSIQPGVPSEQQRRHGEAEQQVLHHVRAEQVRVAQVVKRAVQRQRRSRASAGEERDALARVGATGDFRA